MIWEKKKKDLKRCFEAIVDLTFPSMPLKPVKLSHRSLSKG